MIWLLVGGPAYGRTPVDSKPSLPEQISDGLPAVEFLRRNPAFLISPESVLSQLNKNKDLVLVDVRPSHHFNNFKIPGSINLPLFALGTKPFLKSGHVILINEGRNYTLLEQKRRQLMDWPDLPAYRF